MISRLIWALAYILMAIGLIIKVVAIVVIILLLIALFTL